MGYELLLRSPAPDKPVALEALVAKLVEAASSGVPARPPETASQASPSPTSPTTGGTPSAPSAASTSPAQPAGAAEPAAAAPQPAPAPLPLGPWTLKNGKGRVEVRLSKAEGAEGFRGADFDVPFGGTEEELRDAFAFVASLASQLQLSAFDPQLATLVGKASEENVVARWRESQAWMVDTVGLLDDPRSVAPIGEPPPLVTRTNKIILAVIGLALLLWWLWSKLTMPDLPVDL